MLNGPQSGEENCKKLCAWIKERWACKDWQTYSRGGKLNRSEIAKECAFARSVFVQNPKVGRLLADLEATLREQDILAPVAVAPDATASGIATRIDALKLVEHARRVEQLEMDKASLLAEVAELKRSVKQHDIWERYMQETGRVLRP